MGICQIEGCKQPTYSDAPTCKYCALHAEEMKRIQRREHNRRNRQNGYFKQYELKRRGGKRMTTDELRAKFGIPKNGFKAAPLKVPMPNHRKMRPDTFEILAKIHGVYV